MSERVLEGRVAVVTGAAKGLGFAVAEAYAAEGATVVVSDIDAAGAEEAAGKLEGAEAVTCDVTDESQVQALIDGTKERHGSVDIVVANAGIATIAPLVEMTLEQWRQVTAVNLDGVFLTLKHAGRVMAGQGSGSIIVMASVTAFSSSPLIGNYSASKAGAVSLAKTASTELRNHGVRVNAICPGWISTDLVNDRISLFEEALGVEFEPVIAQAQGRFGEPGDVAPLAVFLASDRASFTTGTAFNVDGGLTASLL